MIVECSVRDVRYGRISEVELSHRFQQRKYSRAKVVLSACLRQFLSVLYFSLKLYECYTHLSYSPTMQYEGVVPPVR